MTTWNPPETAPKDGNPFLGDFGYPWPSYCLWNEYGETWCIVTPQSCPMESGKMDTYFECEWEKPSELKRWMPLPAM